MTLYEILIYVSLFVFSLALGFTTSFSRYRLLILGLIAKGIFFGLFFPIEMHELFLHLVLILALIFMIFYLAAHFRVNEFDTLSKYALKFALKTIVLTVIVIGSIAWVLFEENPFYTAVLVLILIGTDPQTINTSTKKIMYLERYESAFKSLVTAVLIFLLIAMGNSSTQLDLGFDKAYGMILGVGTGLVLSLLYFNFTENIKGVTYYFSTILFSAVVFFISRALDGNGILSLAVVGFLFANLHISGRKEIRIIAKKFSRYTMLPVFVIIVFYGMVEFPQKLFDHGLIIKTLILFAVYLLIRFTAVHFSTNGLPLKFREKIYMVLNNPHGSTPALAVLYLIVYQPQSMLLAAAIIQLLVFSLLTSAVFEYIVKGEAWKK
ncbi:MAG: cation:proton antiporter [Candidatus Nanoarchaeia archaeon]